jgi:hypothetical protein
MRHAHTQPSLPITGRDNITDGLPENTPPTLTAQPFSDIPVYRKLPNFWIAGPSWS